MSVVSTTVKKPDLGRNKIRLPSADFPKEANGLIQGFDVVNGMQAPDYTTEHIVLVRTITVPAMGSTVSAVSGPMERVRPQWTLATWLSTWTSVHHTRAPLVASCLRSVPWPQSRGYGSTCFTLTSVPQNPHSITWLNVNTRTFRIHHVCGTGVCHLIGVEHPCRPLWRQSHSVSCITQNRQIAGFNPMRSRMNRNDQWLKLSWQAWQEIPVLHPYPPGQFQPFGRVFWALFPYHWTRLQCPTFFHIDDDDTTTICCTRNANIFELKYRNLCDKRTYFRQFELKCCNILQHFA